MEFLEKQIQRMRKKEENVVQKKAVVRRQDLKQSENDPAAANTDPHQAAAEDDVQVSCSNTPQLTDQVQLGKATNMKNRAKMNQFQNRMKPNGKYMNYNNINKK